MFGSSRSGREDFVKTVKFLEENKEAVRYFENLIGDVIDVRTIPDIHKAFDADLTYRIGKTVLHWNK